MNKTVDDLIAIRIMYMLVHPFNTWDAFKLGIIDKDGKKIKEPKSWKEKSSWTMLHRFIGRLKLLMSKIPGGSSQIASIVAAYMLVREAKEKHDFSLEFINEKFDIMMITPDEKYDIARILGLIEETVAPMTSTGNVALGTDENGPWKNLAGKKSQILRRGMPLPPALIEPKL